jgi:glycosyltransferase involved in cell wall biosynthesis
MRKREIFLSVIIPVYNEEKTVDALLGRVQRYLPPLSEIIVVDDGSTDKTSNVLQAFKRKRRVQVFTLPYNRGKGHAVRLALSKARGKVFIIQDADLEYDPADYNRLLKPIREGRAEVVYGSRLAKYPFSFSTLTTIPLPLHFIANRLLSLLTNILYGSQLTDMETCYKVFSRKVYQKLHLTRNRFDIEAEITAKILGAGFEIYEIPIETKPRSYQEGKKITWKDGVCAVLTLVECRFVDRKIT